MCESDDCQWSDEYLWARMHQINEWAERDRKERELYEALEKSHAELIAWQKSHAHLFVNLNEKLKWPRDLSEAEVGE